MAEKVLSDPKPYVYKCDLDRVVDGDTVDVHVKLGFDVMLRKQRVRLAGIDTPESRTRDLEEKKRGLAAKAFVETWLEEKAGNSPIIETKVDKKGKFGRILGRVLNDEGECLNDTLLAEGHAVEYFGGKR